MHILLIASAILDEFKVDLSNMANHSETLPLGAMWITEGRNAKKTNMKGAFWPTELKKIGFICSEICVSTKAIVMAMLKS